jgi:hypothetical protein
VFPTHTTLSAVKVTKATALNGKCSESSYIADLIEGEVHNEHLSLIVDLLHLSPAKVMCLARALEGKNATVVDAEVQLVAPVILQQASWLYLSNHFKHSGYFEYIPLKHLGILQYSHKGHFFFYEPYGKQQLLPYTALTMWSLHLRHSMFAMQ